MTKKSKRGLLDRKPAGILGRIAAAFGAGVAEEAPPPDEAETEEHKIPAHLLKWAEEDELGDEEERTIVGFGDYEVEDEDL